MLGSPSEPGIIPLAVDELFSHIHHQQSRRSYSLRVSFLEIYNEQLRDLLAPPPSTFTLQPAKGPEIVENGVVKHLEERAVSLPEEVLEVLKEGETRRRVGATDWNERSSRSHCVFIVVRDRSSGFLSAGAYRGTLWRLLIDSFGPCTDDRKYEQSGRIGADFQTCTLAETTAHYSCARLTWLHDRT